MVPEGDGFGCNVETTRMIVPKERGRHPIYRSTILESLVLEIEHQLDTENNIFPMTLSSNTMPSVVAVITQHAQEATLYIVATLIISLLLVVTVLKVRYN